MQGSQVADRVTLFNLLKHFNPRDGQQNLVRAHLGECHRVVKRKTRVAFETEY